MLDNAQWLDSLSLALAQEILEPAPQQIMNNVFVVVATRGTSDTFLAMFNTFPPVDPALFPCTEAENVVHLPVAPMNDGGE